MTNAKYCAKCGTHFYDMTPKGLKPGQIIRVPKGKSVFDVLDDMKANIPKADEVKNPSHYNKDGIECWDAIKASLSEEGWAGYCKGNVMKYVWRYEYKGKALQDLMKANEYLAQLMKSNYVKSLEK